LLRQLEAADLGPNMIEIPVNDKRRSGNAPATTTDSSIAEENATSERSGNGNESQPKS
jgi:hypothetical protein